MKEELNLTSSEKLDILINDLEDNPIRKTLYRIVMWCIVTVNLKILKSTLNFAAQVIRTYKSKLTLIFIIPISLISLIISIISVLFGNFTLKVVRMLTLTSIDSKKRYIEVKKEISNIETELKNIIKS